MHCLSCNQIIVPEITWSNFILPDRLSNCCSSCSEKLSLIHAPTCLICGREQNPAQKICSDCSRWQANYRMKNLIIYNRSVYHYDDFIKTIIARWKYRGDYQLYQLFTITFQEKFKQYFPNLPKPTYLVPIPLSSERLKHRAFNQAEALAQLLPYPSLNILTRREGEKQSKKNRKQRIMMKNPFTLNRELPAEAKSVILIDDIYTTGTTLRHAATLIQQAGCEQIYSYTLAR